jgi:mycothiol synthase
VTISPADNSDLGVAFALLYGEQPGATSEDAAHAFRLVARGELDPDNLFVARSGGKVVGAVFCEKVPGASAIVWPPRAVGNDPAVEDALTAAAIEHAAGAKVLQTFLPPELVGLGAPLKRSGFKHVTRVWQMHRGSGTTRGRPVSDLTFVPYAECSPAEAQDVLVRSHEDSADCPELQGIRTPDEMEAGYRDAAPDPARWWVARQFGDAVGVLILNNKEVSFVGVVPERRGQRIGRALVEAACAVSPTLTLIVDARNAPALQLYRSTGFDVIGAREVFLRLLDPSAGATPKKDSRF